MAAGGAAAAQRLGVGWSEFVSQPCAAARSRQLPPLVLQSFLMKHCSYLRQISSIHLTTSRAQVPTDPSSSRSLTQRRPTFGSTGGPRPTTASRGRGSMCATSSRWYPPSYIRPTCLPTQAPPAPSTFLHKPHLHPQPSTLNPEPGPPLA